MNDAKHRNLHHGVAEPWRRRRRRHTRVPADGRGIRARPGMLFMTTDNRQDGNSSEQSVSTRTSVSVTGPCARRPGPPNRDPLRNANDHERQTLGTAAWRPLAVRSAGPRRLASMSDCDHLATDLPLLLANAASDGSVSLPRIVPGYASWQDCEQALLPIRGVCERGGSCVRRSAWPRRGRVGWAVSGRRAG